MTTPPSTIRPKAQGFTRGRMHLFIACVGVVADDGGGREPSFIIADCYSSLSPWFTGALLCTLVANTFYLSLVGCAIRKRMIFLECLNFINGFVEVLDKLIFEESTSPRFRGKLQVFLHFLLTQLVPRHHCQKWSIKFIFYD